MASNTPKNPHGAGTPIPATRDGVAPCGTLALSWGRYGGFYVHRYRICLGWVALTWLPLDLDDVLSEAYPEILP